MTDEQKTIREKPRVPFNRILTQKEKELIALGTSIAAGCQPCTAHHFKAVRQAGATEAEIRQAVDDALCVRNSATKIMGGLAEKHLGNEYGAEEPCYSSKLLIGELVSIGAALAVNCTTNLETHVQAARAAGATDHQIQMALAVARAVKKVAQEKAETVAKAVVRSEAEAVISNGCGGQVRDDGGGCCQQKAVTTTADVEVEGLTEPCGCG
jgi:AhpD family alkylhydroperoxidase